jgi:hypothetical protein
MKGQKHQSAIESGRENEPSRMNSIRNGATGRQSLCLSVRSGNGSGVSRRCKQQKRGGNGDEE